MIEEVKSGVVEEEKTILVGIYGSDITKQEATEHIDELEMLTNTAGGVCVEKVLQHRFQPNPATYIGKGKLNEIANTGKNKGAQTMIFDDDLTSTQLRNIEKVVKCKVLDRSSLILDIFAARAQTAAAKTQVELAQLQYLLPRLTRFWTHLSRQKGGIGTKGPGETQIETDRRLVGRRIAVLKEKLKKLDQQRATQRKQRSAKYRIALVGYTNAGKSTLMNTLTDTNVLAENKLFATLDATVRKHQLGQKEVLISDTVGFIRKLPHNLIESFKSTLDEVRESDILLHVVDASSPVKDDYIDVVEKTLQDLDCNDKTTLLCFNKIDAMPPEDLQMLRNQYPDAFYLSAARGIGIATLESRLEHLLNDSFVEVQLSIPVTESALVAKIHENAEVQMIKYVNDRVEMFISIDKKQKKLIDIISKYELSYSVQ